MIKLASILAGVAFIGLLGVTTPAHAQSGNPNYRGPCAGLTGAARTNCLRAEVERNQREIDRINQRNRNLDRAKDVVCGARTVGGSAAGAAGQVVGGTPGRVAATGTWYGSTAVGDAATGQKAPCTPRAQ